MLTPLKRRFPDSDDESRLVLTKANKSSWGEGVPLVQLDRPGLEKGTGKKDKTRDGVKLAS